MAIKVETPGEKQVRVFKDYIQRKKIMIVDSQAYSRATLARTLIELGAGMSQITLCGSYHSAQSAIEKNCPDILLSEYDLDGGNCGLDLLASQRKINKNSKNSLFFLFTANTSQAAVAQAAEEDVDGYLIKPYTLDGLRMALMKYALEKAFPNPYITLIDQGKDLMAANNLDEAMKFFDEAIKAGPKPSLAYYYRGRSAELKKTLSNAEADYNKGLEYNRMHYKCMLGLYELFTEQKRNKEAYEVVRKMARYFPASPERLASVLRLAVINEAFDDIERYYQLFCKIDQRNEMLIRYVCAALIVCGKYYLRHKAHTRAVELFEKAKKAGSRSPRILKEIIASLLQYDLVSEAEQFLGSYPNDQQGSTDYQALKYAVRERGLPAGVSIAQGRELLAQGAKEFFVYYTLIARSIEGGFEDHASQLAQEAIYLWPTRAEEFKALMERINAPKKPFAA